MRKLLIAGNWKMNTGLEETSFLVSSIDEYKSTHDNKNVEVLVCPPYVNLITAVDTAAGSPVKVGAQNCYYEDKGAFTGEISANMLREIGCKYVIIGHSERREIFKEDDELINKKIVAVMNHKLTPILCIGEKLEERQAGNTNNILESQLEKALQNVEISDYSKFVIAYEPVWAIGTGISATTEQANETHNWIRNYLIGKLGAEAEDIRILYGGSMNEMNALELLKLENVDGGLIGGASLKASSFNQIIEIANSVA